MKKHYLLSVLFATFLIFISFHGVHAQGTASISGDELCGGLDGPRCNISHLKIIAQNILYTFVAIGSVAMFIFIAYRLLQSQFAVMGGNAGARAVASKNIFNALAGFFIVVAVGGLFVVALKALGAQAWTTKLLQLLSDAFIPHAYAADERLLPNPLFANNLFDLILAIMNLVIKFFIYPAIIVLWVWSGFQFVYSQGNPEGLKKAKSWLLWTVIITVVIFTLQGFLLAFKNTAQKIAPQNAAFIQPTTGTPNGSAQSASGSCQGKSDGTACTVGGRAGTCTKNEDGVFSCYATPGQPITNCEGQADGTACTVGGRAGTCTKNEDGVFSCYATPARTEGRTLVGRGGSCQIDKQCEGDLHCLNFICK